MFAAAPAIVVSFLQVPIARPSYASRRLRRLLSAWVSEVSGLADSGAQGADVRVLWAEQNLPRPALPFITLREISSASVNSQQRILSDIPTTLEITIQPAVTAVALSVNYGTYRASGGGLLSDITDALLSGPDAFDVVITGADSFELSGQPGALVWPFQSIEGLDITPTGLRTVGVQETTRTSTVRIEIAGANTPNERALDYGDALIIDLQRAATTAAFAQRGASTIGARPTLTDISALSGGERETRAFFDVQFAQWARHITEDPAAVATVAPPDIELQRPVAAS